MTPTLTIRKVLKRDEPILASIIKAAFEEHDAPKEGTVYSDPTTEHLFELFKNPKSILWVAEWNGQVVGCCGLYPTVGLPSNTVELVKFYLNPMARGKGIGKTLLETNIQSAKELNYQEIYLESLPQFSQAVDFYSRIGFKKLENPMGNSGHNTCSIWMLLSLSKM